MDFYDELEKVKKDLRITNEDIGKVIDKSGDTLRKALNRKSLSNLEKEAISKEYNLKTLSDVKIKSENIPSISDKGVPYYDVDFHGGFDPVFNDQTVRPNFYIDFPPYNDCDAWINVTGKSMSPFISHGDIAALKKLDGWREFMPFGEVYAVYTTEHRTIKIVSAGKDDDHLTLIPYNKGREFVEQQIPKNIIREMFRVYGSIKKFF